MRNIPRTTKHRTQVFVEIRRITLPRRQRKLKVELKKTVARVQWDKESLFERPFQARWISFETITAGSLRTRSRDIPEFNWREPGNKGGSFSEWFSTWNGCLSEPMFSIFWPRRDFLQWLLPNVTKIPIGKFLTYTNVSFLQKLTESYLNYIFEPSVQKMFRTIDSQNIENYRFSKVRRFYQKKTNGDRRPSTLFKTPHSVRLVYKFV